MKKKIITFMLIFTILFIGGVSIVKAATVNVVSNKANPKVGETITITVSFSQPVATASFKLNYNSSVLQYVSDTINGTNTGSSVSVDYIDLVNLSTISSANFTFKVKKQGTAGITISGLTISDSEGNELSVSAGSTTISVKEETSNTGSNSSSSNNTSTGSNSSSSNNTSTGSNSSSSNNTSTGSNSSSSNNTSTGTNSNSSNNTSTGSNSNSSNNTSTGSNSNSSNNTSTGSNSNSSNNTSTGSNSSSSNSTSTGSNSNKKPSSNTTNNTTTNKNQTIENNIIEETNNEIDKNEINESENTQENINKIDNELNNNESTESIDIKKETEKKFNNLIYITIGLIIIVLIAIFITKKRNKK